MQKVLVTGANGFLGFYLCRLLLDQGYQVLATGKAACRLPILHPRFEYRPLDFTHPGATAGLLAQAEPDAVVHAGAVTSPDACALDPDLAWQVNVAGTRNVLAASQATGAYLLYVSTDFVFAGTKPFYAEDDDPDPVNEYGRTKAAAEALVKEYPGQWAIARPIMLYGVPQTGKQNLLTMVGHALLAQRTMRLFTDQQRLPTYIEDFTAGLAQMLATQRTGIFHFCGMDALTPFDIGIKVAHFLQLDAALIHPVTAAEFHQPAARPARTMFHLDKVIKELAFKPTSFEEGMRRSLVEFQF